MKQRFSTKLIAACLLLAQGGSASAGITVSFQYLDSNNFFDTQAKKDLLQLAANSVVSRLADTLDAIIPGTHTWDAEFTHPSTGVAGFQVSNPTIPADTLVIYVGARNLGGPVGLGGPGGYSASGDTDWFDLLDSRGEAGYFTNDDFAPWGGSISFDLATSWYFDPNPATSEIFSGVDFYSVAIHELGHVLGISSGAPSWTSKISGGFFTGPASYAANGSSNVPLHNNAHWAANTMSTLPGSGAPQEAAMDPDIMAGDRKVFTTLDFAGLQDIGWEVTPVPEPAMLGLLTSVGLAAFGFLRSRQGRQN